MSEVREAKLEELDNKYKGCNLPVLDYDLGFNPVYVYNMGFTYVKNRIEPCLNDCAWVFLNYYVHSKFFERKFVNDRYVNTGIVEKDSILYSMEELLENLYNFPETFKLDENHLDGFSKQELRFINKIQSYLLFIGLKDVTLDTDMKERCKNKIIDKYANYTKADFEDFFIDKLIKGDINFNIFREWREYDEENAEDEIGDKELIFDEKGNIRMAVERINSECKLYKEVKDQIDDHFKDRFNDDDKLYVNNYKVLEIFK